MKKYYMFCLAIMASYCLLGQNESPNLESFELPTLPECWLVLDEDGDTYTWGNSYQIQNENGSFTQGSTGVGVMRSDSYINGIGPLTPDNYLILPQLSVQAGEHLEWQIAGLDPMFSAEKYEVLVSTTGNDAADFTDSLFTETIESTSFEARFVDLEAYVGQEIYIAFRHFDVTNQFAMRLDDVRYPTTVNDCAIVVGVEETEVSNVFSVFPNPSAGLVNLQLVNTQDQLVEVFNLYGQKVFSKNFQANSGIISLDLRDLARGIYTLNLTSQGAVATEKLVLR